MTKIFRLLLAFLFVAVLVACSPKTEESSGSTSSASYQESSSQKKTDYPVSIKTYDAEGKEVEQVFEQAPQKVITNNLSITEMMIELGLEDRIIGMLKPDNVVTGKYKEAISKIKQVGDKKTISREAILAYEPDALIGRNMMFSEKSLGTVSSWNDNQIPIYSQKASISNGKQDLGNIVEDVKNLGIIFDVQDRAEAYADDLQARIDAVEQNTRKEGELKKALIMCAYDGSRFGTYKSALQESVLNRLGYTNIATGTSDLTLENLVAMAPELIIYVTSDRNKQMDETAVDDMLSNPVLEGVPALADKQVMTISYDEFMDYGPVTVTALEKIDEFVKK